MKRYALVDVATQGYIALVALLVLLFHGERLTVWPWLLLAHGAGFALIHGLIRIWARFPANWPLDLLRHYYPIPLFIAFYRETELLNQMFHAGYLDADFLRFEQWAFGLQPGLDFMRRFPERWVAEVLYAAYFSYYLMIAGLGLALLLRDRRQFAHFISVVSLMLYVCYLIYIFLPVVGPRIVYPGVVDFPLPQNALPALDFAPPESVQSTLFFRIMGWIYDHFETAGAAFPSSHVAVAVCTVYFSFLYLRRIRYVHLIAVVLVCVSTVYGRYHYVVDVAAGLVTAGVLIPLGNRLHFKFANRAGVEPRFVDPKEPAKPCGPFPT
jgi:membrane-associated phospholipid phosphatase